ncbi:glycosyltransferase family 8 protein [Pedobacter sp. PWIIR3]
MNNNISIFVASDNFYAVLIAALLKSLDINHKTSEHIDFHIIDDGISKSTREKLETIVSPSRFSLYWYKSKNVIPTDLAIPIDGSGFPLTTYLRLFGPGILPAELEKVIYLDVDVVVQDDISKFWNMPLNGKTVGAIQDIAKTVDCVWGGLPNYKELGLEPETKYFNAGVLLIDVKKWREENIAKQAINALIEHREHVQLGDQYALNVVFAKKWNELDPNWNWFASLENPNPSLIHYLDIKPIFSTYKSQPVFKDIFFEYLAQTPWKNYKVISGKNRIIRKLYNKLKKAFLKRLK